MSIFVVEMVLVFVLILFWFGPFLLSLKNRTINVLHPQFITPLWMTYFVLNTMIQVWYPWMGGTEYGILKTTSAEISHNRDYLLFPLLVLLLSAPFFHLGVRFFCATIVKDDDIFSKLIKNLKVVNNNRSDRFTLYAILLSSVVWIPNYIMPNGGYGTFWTYPLAMTNMILPLIIFNISRVIGVISLAFALLGASIMQSKAAFVYPLLPFLFYYIYLYFDLRRLKSWVIVLVAFSTIVTALSLGGFGTNARRVLHRDYAFESFAALVDKANNKYLGSLEYIFTGEKNSAVQSWTFKEIEEGIPSILYPGKKYRINPAKVVTNLFLPEDYEGNSNTYFNRFFTFSGYHDLGMIGAFINAMMFGMFYGWIWKTIRAKTIKVNQSWPVFLYLPIPAIASYFIAVGGISYGLINAFVPIFMVAIILFLSKIKIFRY